MAKTLNIYGRGNGSGFRFRYGGLLPDGRGLWNTVTNLLRRMRYAVTVYKDTSGRVYRTSDGRVYALKGVRVRPPRAERNIIYRDKNGKVYKTTNGILMYNDK